MPNLILSPVGTSVLTHGCDRDTLDLLRRTANKEETELTAEERSQLEAHVRSVRDAMQSATREDWRRRSAEVNGILSYGQPGRSDVHVLLASDTWQGQRAAEIVSQFIRDDLRCSCSTETPSRLSTRSREDFHAGMVEFVKWCGDNVPGYRESGYHIVFNLTGGFKSVQGYLNTLGMLYADEIVYIFEPPSGGLIVIPRLPIKVDKETLARDHAVVLEMLYRRKQIRCDRLDLSGIPESLIEIVPIDDSDYASLSVWGLAIWQETRKSALGEQLLQWPKLTYTDEFRKEYSKLGDTNVKVQVQEVLATVSAILLENDGDINQLRNDGGVQYEDYEFHPGISHFRVDKGRRISCESTEQGLLLRHVGTHDYVNKRP